MSAMEPISEGKRVLWDIEQSIQNALALFNSKDINGGNEPLYTIEDPIVSLHYQKINQPNEIIKNQNSENEDKKSESSKNVKELSNFSQILYSKAFENVNSDDKYLPFLDNPMKSTVEEMQRVLNAKGDGFPTITEPSPEDILNLYSKDLGISLSTNVSPRAGDVSHFDKQLIDNETPKVKQSKKDKKASKKMKQQKLKSQEIKTELKKGKLSKSDLPHTKEHKLRDLMNIYGCSDKVKKSQSDSGSKSGVSKHPSSRKMVVLNNCSSTTSSIAISKKSKRKKKKIASKIDYDLQDEDFAALDKSSRVSIRRKNKPKSSTAKLLRKTTLKRKIMNQNNDTTDSKLSKSHQTVLRDSKYATNKTNNGNYPSKEKNYKNLRQIKFKNPNQSQKNTTFNKFSEVNNFENNILTKSNHKLFLNTFGHKKQSYTSKITTKLNDYEMQNKKQNVFYDKQSHNVIDGDKLMNSLQKKISKETKLNRSIFSIEKSVPISNNFLIENSDQPNTEVGFESMRDDLISQTAQHYALPTQSSRSKEVERFLSGHYQYLPFVIGQSTNKSHNLWVNIQEALSLIKQKIPQTAEVHNVVYESENERPLSVSSKLTNKTVKKAHQCPAIVNDGLYDIPEGSTEAEEATKSWEDHPECIQANIDPNHVRPRCSCVPQQPLSYKKVLRQLFGGGTTDNSETTLGDRDEFVQDKGADNYTAELKKTLISFTQEFEDLNKKYEEMLADQNTPKEDLERTEILLKNKEEEIKEILTRFNEVKEITDRNHLEGNKTRGGFYNLESYKSTTSVRLAQTLRRVQIFKESLKRRPSGAYPTKNVLVQSSY